ncbi:hypothetical protein NSERUTF1_1699 [Nocardia seriolae]|nr:hypothetical protein NSERUTF1_1699 [Nocardia seriolae]
MSEFVVGYFMCRCAGLEPVGGGMMRNGGHSWLTVPDAAPLV